MTLAWTTKAQNQIFADDVDRFAESYEFSEQKPELLSYPNSERNLGFSFRGNQTSGI